MVQTTTNNNNILEAPPSFANYTSSSEMTKREADPPKAIPYMVIYPNPASDYITAFIKPFDTRDIKRIRIVNAQYMDIKTIDAKNITAEGPIKLGIQFLNNGIYSLIVETSNQTFAQKFFVNR